MKFNWVNLLATLLILGGVGLLIERQFHGAPKKHVPTIEEAKADIERQIEVKLGRPLSDAEVEMIDVSKTGEQISITLHQPLTGRLMRAIHDAKAATNPSLLNSANNLPPPGSLPRTGNLPPPGALAPVPGGNDFLPAAPEIPNRLPDAPTPAPTTGIP